MKTFKIFFSIVAITLISLQVSAQPDLKANGIYWPISKDVQTVSDKVWRQNGTNLTVKSVDMPDGVISKRVNNITKSTLTRLGGSDGNVISTGNTNWFHSKGVCRVVDL